VIFCKAGERKHRIAEAYLATHEVGIGGPPPKPWRHAL